MFFLDQFEKFDPASGEVPSHPFAQMPAIASRARAILGLWTSPDIDHLRKTKTTLIAQRINKELEQYFEDIKLLEIERRRAQEGILESMGGDQDWPSDDEDLDIETWENTSEVDALKSVLENRDSHLFYSKDPLPKSEEYPEGKDHELFAVLALWMLADSLYFLSSTPVGLSIAGTYALKAMDAVCYAEHLRDAAWLTSYSEKLGDAKVAETLREQDEESRRQKTALSKQLNLVRHQKTSEARTMAIEEFMKDPHRFPSAEKAGNHLADWLRDYGRSYEPRTVTNWIRAYAKSINLRFR